MHAPAPTPPPPPSSRAHLVPIPGGPWLDDTRQTTFCRTMAIGGGLVALVSAIIIPLPRALVGFWITMLLFGLIIAVFGLLGYGTGLLARRSMQTCPTCLCRMPRGATTCPHCHFHSPQEDV